MAYANTVNPRRRAATIGTVAMFHALLGYALVTGLAGRAMSHIDPRLTSIFVEKEKPRIESPPPAEHHDTRPTPQHHADPVLPPPDTNFANPDPIFETAGVTVKDGDGIVEANFPVNPPPPPAPQFTSRGVRTLGKSGTWVTPNDYPANDLRLGHEGLTKVRLMIGTNGRVSGCAVTASSGWKGLDDMACSKLTANGRFEPASDNTGAKVEGTFNTSVKWQIPED